MCLLLTSPMVLKMEKKGYTVLKTFGIYAWAKTQTWWFLVCTEDLIRYADEHITGTVPKGEAG